MAAWIVEEIKAVQLRLKCAHGEIEVMACDEEVFVPEADMQRLTASPLRRAAAVGRKTPCARCLRQLLHIS